MYRDLSDAFKQLLLDQDDEDVKNDNVRPLSGDKMGLQELMQMWDSRAQEESNAANMDFNDDTPAEEASGVPNLDVYSWVIFNAPSYEWLCKYLRNKILLTNIDTGPMADIAQTVLRVLPKPERIRQGISAPRFEAVIKATWSPSVFVQQQWISGFQYGDVAHVVTLTSSGSDVQALTCSEYLATTWPSNGIHFLRLIEGVLQSSDSLFSYLCPDGTYLLAWQQGPIFKMKVLGTRDLVAEAAQQLAWLGAALRSAPLGHGTAYCLPTMRYVGAEDVLHEGSGDGGHPMSSTEAQQLMGQNTTLPIQQPIISTTRVEPSDRQLETVLHIFEINFEVSLGNEDTGSGSCWRNMFENPVIVRDFPIQRRPQPNLGLEIPFNIMAGLVDTRHITTCYGAVYLKGFSAMLAPVSRIDGIVLWHYFGNHEGGHIDYLKKGAAVLTSFDPAEASRTRHIVGWCPGAFHFAGSANSEYNIGRSRLLKTKLGCVLSDCSIPLSRAIEGGAPYLLLKKDRPKTSPVQGTSKNWAIFLNASSCCGM